MSQEIVYWLLSSLRLHPFFWAKLRGKKLGNRAVKDRLQKKRVRDVLRHGIREVKITVTMYVYDHVVRITHSSLSNGTEVKSLHDLTIHGYH